MSQTETRPADITPANTQQSTTEILPKNVANTVMKQLQALQDRGGLILPADYSVENALRNAWFYIQNSDQKDKILACTPESQANALYDMCLQGLDISKLQGYLIPYDKRLKFQRSYHGDIVVAMRVQPGIVPYVDVIYEGEAIRPKKLMNKYGYVTTIEHEPFFPRKENTQIIGAYCGFVDSEGIDMGAELMDLAQIKMSWKKSKTYGEKSQTFHNEQPDQACKRTVVRRRCKPIIYSSTDRALLEAVRRQEQEEVEGEMGAEVAANGNGRALSVSAPTIAEPEQTPPSQPIAGGAASKDETAAGGETPPGGREGEFGF